jgi:hypothetical protein
MLNVASTQALNSAMKQLFLSAAAVLASSAGQAQVPMQAQRLSELRAAIQQTQVSGAASPRQLSAEERAELRRQIQQQSRAHGKS